MPWETSCVERSSCIWPLHESDCGPSGPEDICASPPNQLRSVGGPCQQPTLGEAGLTSEGITTAMPAHHEEGSTSWLPALVDESSAGTPRTTAYMLCIDTLHLERVSLTIDLTLSH